MQIAGFIYNNAKNASTRYIFFKPNYRNYYYILFKKDVNSCSRFKLENKLANIQKKLNKLKKSLSHSKTLKLGL